MLYFISKKLKKFSKNADKYKKFFILFILDITFLLVSNFISFSILRFNSEIIYENGFVVFLYLITAGLIYIFSGQYATITRYLTSKNYYGIITRNIILQIIFYISFLKLGSNIVFFIISLLITINFQLFIRLLIKEILYFLDLGDKNFNRKRIAIYGAGAAGAKLAASLRLDTRIKIQCFFDDSSQLWERNLYGFSIYSPEKLSSFINEIDQLCLSIPSLDRKEKAKIIKKISYLKKYGIEILEVPSIEEISSNKNNILKIKPIPFEEFLNRRIVDPFPELLCAAVQDKSICVFGGAGSIGRELCLQIVKLKAKKLLLVDSNEFGLYKAKQEIDKINQLKIEVHYLLGNATNKFFLKSLFRNHKKIDIIFHAAAYKHVPLVELNPIEGVHNNVFSTFEICKIARKMKVEKFIFISTDKAVRPTNVMGVSKRLCELIIQSFSTLSNESIFSIVRFGNVLGSTGSVIPLFKKQIEEGGPITITDKNVERYFMTIKEACELVIQTCELARGGEVFLLDMGKPVKIVELAKQMIINSGKKIKDQSHQFGDIELNYIGMRPGEKLFEELLIDSKSSATKHPLIFKADEKKLDNKFLMSNLILLRESIKNNEIEMFNNTLKNLVPEWETRN